MSRAELLAEAVLASRPLTLRYFTGFNEGGAGARQVPSLPNHAIWSLGHLAITMHRLAERLDGRPLSTADFLYGGSLDGGGDAARFASESVAFGSHPNPDPSHYPDFQRAVQIFENAIDRLAAAVRAAPEDKLDEMMPWGKVSFPAWQIVLRMVFHNGMHAGQMADLRRALGMGSINT